MTSELSIRRAGPTTLEVNGRTVELKVHMARLTSRFPPNSLEAAEEALRTGAGVVEVDIVALADGTFLVTHETRLGRAIAGDPQVLIAQLTRAEARRLRFRDASGGPPLLEELVDLALAIGGTTRLHLDLKEWHALPPAAVAYLAGQAARLNGRAVVGSAADWNLQRIHAAAPQVTLGYDPLLRLDYRDKVRPDAVPSYLGRHGYLDDDPIARVEGLSAAEYLEQRFAALTCLVPRAREFYVRWQVLLRAADQGFDLTGFLHARGLRVDAWTLDQPDEPALAVARRLLALGVDQLTTNAPLAFAEALTEQDDAGRGETVSR
jgi:glycerophosphoryl diester phosphodiesterase